MLDGHTRLVAHIGEPTGSFKAPMIYNPFFEAEGINAAVVPMGVRAEDFTVSFPAIFRFTNVAGALITMPHKVSVVRMLDRVSPAVAIAGSCNAVRRDPDGALVGDMFDGEGFVRGLIRKGRSIAGAAALVVGAGGVGSAIAAALAGAGIARIGLCDTNSASAEALGARLRVHFPQVEVTTGAFDLGAFSIAINATPLGMRAGDPLPFDVARAAPGTFIGEVVMKRELTPLLEAARARDLPFQIGIDMLFEQIPAYLEFFGFPAATPERLRALARITY
jgi:shikimate dehydrogenase